MWDKIILIPEKWKKEDFLTGQTSQIMTFAADSIFLVSKGDLAGDILACDSKSGDCWPLIEKGSRFASAQVVRHYTEKNSSTMVFEVAVPGGRGFFQVDLKEGENKCKDLTDLFPESLSDVQWQPGKESQLFVLEKGNISRIDEAAGAVYPDIIKGVKGFGLYGDRIYCVDNTGLCFYTGLNGKNNVDLIEKNKTAEKILAGMGQSRIDVYSDSFFTVLDNNGKLVTNKIPYTVAEKGIKGYLFFEPAKRLLFWTDKKLGILDLSEEKTGNVSFEREPEKSWIYSKGKDIGQAFWVYQDSHVLFKDVNTVYLVELEDSGENEIYEVLKVQKRSGIIYSEETGNVYFIDPDTSEVMFIDIIPEAGILPEYLNKIKEQKKHEKIGEKWNLILPETD